MFKGKIVRTKEEAQKVLEFLRVEYAEAYSDDEVDSNKNSAIVGAFAMLHQFWKGVVPADSIDWIQNTITDYQHRKSLDEKNAVTWPEDETYLDSLKAMVDSGIDPNHITNVVRRAQENLLNHVCYSLSDPWSDEKELKDIFWAAFETDEDGNPVREMNVLHEMYWKVNPDRK